ncbi:hypothetical protein [Methylobacterium longum]|uniref:Uncharacterized protein n=1 Tax=Methylobacterium longum TaxID=767694 RepID=A0ABT8ANX4_9HYPH|nr:hypothetical protein [Methylobacterium longum]MDN3571547.1 hypothetical protein [Methylobacterium longum]GJE12473.1 hypothetical protein FOHLNKBM_3522 [Methylobacterium longum]
MTPLTPAGWILFAAMWVAGPITGFTACSLIAAAWEHKAVDRRAARTVGLFGTLLAITTALLMLVGGL